MLLRDTGPQLRTRNKKVPSVSEQKKKDQRKVARKKERKRQEQIQWMRRKASKAEVALRVVLAILPLAAFVGVLGWASTLPDTWKVDESIEVPTDVHTTFAALQDLSTWKHWNADIKATGETPLYPAGAVGRSAIAEVHDGGEAVLRLLLEEVEPGVSVTYFLWKAGDTIPRSGAIKLMAKGARTNVSWQESGTVPDDVLGVFERVALEGRAKEVRAGAKKSLADLGNYLAGAGRKKVAPTAKKEAPAGKPAEPAAKK